MVWSPTGNNFMNQWWPACSMMSYITKTQWVEGCALFYQICHCHAVCVQHKIIPSVHVQTHKIRLYLSVKLIFWAWVNLSVAILTCAGCSRSWHFVIALSRWPWWSGILWRAPVLELIHTSRNYMPQQGLTHWGGNKMLPFCRQHLQMHLLQWKLTYFGSNFTEICFHWSNQ